MRKDVWVGIIDDRKRGRTSIEQVYTRICSGPQSVYTVTKLNVEWTAIALFLYAEKSMNLNLNPHPKHMFHFLVTDF